MLINNYMVYLPISLLYSREVPGTVSHFQVPVRYPSLFRLEAYQLGNIFC